MVLPGPDECRGSRLVPTRANGCPGYGQYRRDPDGGHMPWALQVVEISGGRISELHMFLDTARCSRPSASPPTSRSSPGGGPLESPERAGTIPG